MKTSAIFAAIFLFFSNSAWSQTSSSATTRTDLDICIDRETNKYISDNNKDGKFTSLDQLIQTEKLRIQASLKAKCVLEAQKTANQQTIQQQQAAAAKASAASGATAATAAGAGAAMTAPLLNALIKTLPDDRQQAPAQAAPAVAAAAQPVASGVSPQAGAPVPGAGETAVGGGSAAAQPATMVNGSAGATASGAPFASEPVGFGSTTTTNSRLSVGSDNTSYLTNTNLSAADPNLLKPIDLGLEKSAMNAAAAETTQQIPPLADSSKLLSSVADGGGAKAPATTITSSAEAANTQLLSMAESLSNMKFTFLGTQPTYTQTAALSDVLKAKIMSYTTTTKKACAATAETTEFLCIEGSSPGAIAARKVMDVAGPILAVINSAQKACSSSAKVSKMVGQGLTIAKGVCVAAKLSCDGACTLAASDLTVLTQMSSVQMKAAIEADYTAGVAYCNGLTFPPAIATCQALNVTKHNTSVAFVTGTVQAALTKEKAPTLGTTPGIAARCQSHIKDILLFAVNLAGMKKAQKSAEACEKQLASSGGSTITPTQYCETPANVSTQFCLCQKDNTTTGCPGALAKTTSPGGTDVGGVNIKSAGGTSAFASGFRTSKPNSILNKNGSSLSGLGLDGGSNLNTATQAGGAVGTADPSHLEGAGAQGVSSGYAGDSGSNDSKSGKAIGSDKKWNFGSFGSSGGSSGSYGNAGISANGALSAKQMEAVKRQIASEQLAAEVSSATGKSNWEKVQQRYLMNTNSFLSGR